MKTFRAWSNDYISLCHLLKKENITKKMAPKNQTEESQPLLGETESQSPPRRSTTYGGITGSINSQGKNPRIWIVSLYE